MVKIELVLPLWTVSVVKLRVDILAQIKEFSPTAPSLFY